jgi:hypothetical protein
MHSHILNAWASTLTDPSQATILLEMVKADKFGLLTNDIAQLKKDLQEYYLREKLGTGCCISKQMNLYSRYPANLSPSKPSSEPPTSVTPETRPYRQVLSTSGTKKKP